MTCGQVEREPSKIGKQNKKTEVDIEKKEGRGEIYDIVSTPEHSYTCNDI